MKFKAALLFFELFPVTYTYIVTMNIHCYNLSILNMVKVSNTEISACINNPDCSDCFGEGGGGVLLAEYDVKRGPQCHRDDRVCVHQNKSLHRRSSFNKKGQWNFFTHFLDY